MHTIHTFLNYRKALYLLLLPGCLLTIGFLVTTASAAVSVDGVIENQANITGSERPLDTPTSTPTCLPGWNMVNSPNVGSGNNALSEIAALSPTDVWAAGNYLNTSTNSLQTLIQHWDGTQWTIVPSPNSDTQNNLLTSISALTASDVWAVGYYSTGSLNQTLTMHWDGTQWTIVPSPNESGNANYLTGVEAISSNNVWAVGYSCTTPACNGGQAPSLIQHWDGTQWSIVPSPNPDTNNYLIAVSAVSANDIWAVGYHNSCYGCIALSMMFHYNGSSWSVVSSPNAGTSTNYIQKVAAVSSNDAWAVGSYYVPGPARWRTLTLHWDGTQWTIVTSPNTNTGDNFLHGITAASSNDAWAVGVAYNTSQGSPSQSEILHWDGAQWSLVANANPGSVHNHLWGVAEAASQSVWAVGQYDNGGQSQTLVELYDGSCAPPTPTATNTYTPTPTITPGGPTLTPVPQWNCPAPVVTPTSIQVPWYGGSYTIQVDVGPNCNWRTYWTEEWLNYYCFRSQGPGPGAVYCNFGQNPQPFTRMGNITVCTSPDGDFSLCTGASIFWEPRPAPTNTPVPVPTSTPQPSLNGHVTWQGAPVQPSVVQQQPISLTLKLGATEVNYPGATTDASGYFQVDVSGMANGTYNWRAKGPKFLARSGTVTLTGAPTTSVEMGLMLAGDADNNNVIGATDFNITRATFGKVPGDPGYDSRADFTNDQRVNTIDFSFLKVNFGGSGSPPVTPR